MQNQNLLVISAIAPNKPGIANEITDLISHCGCNIQQSDMNAMGDSFCLVLMASGEWNAIAKLEHVLPSKAHAIGMTTMLQRTQIKQPSKNKIPYKIKIVGLDKHGTTKEITSFFAKQAINIEQMSVNTYQPLQTLANVSELKLTVNIPMDINISSLRQDFSNFCDKRNLDGSLEPITR